MTNSRYANCDLLTLLEDLERSTPLHIRELMHKKVDIDYQIEISKMQLEEVRRVVHQQNSQQQNVRICPRSMWTANHDCIQPLESIEGDCPERHQRIAPGAWCGKCGERIPF